ncbi:hypothetical protein ACT02V_33000, partial [Pseudomonas aeruginosa]|uniref:hypothetical protein n=1 Tax=Pseudomonas aeruginosa TaxID=287 RepID=UPI00402BC169
IELSGAGCTTAITPNQLVQSSSENDRISRKIVLLPVNKLSKYFYVKLLHYIMSILTTLGASSMLIVSFSEDDCTEYQESAALVDCSAVYRA